MRPRLLALALAAGCALTTTVAPARAQLGTFTSRDRFDNAVGPYRFLGALGSVPNGATDVPLLLGTVAPITAHLVGASVDGGRIASATPFVVVFENVPSKLIAFGADFSTSGSGVASIGFFDGATLLGTVSRNVSGPGPQFLGGLFWGPDGPAFGSVQLGVVGAATFDVANLVVATPEPSTVALTAVGVVAVAGMVRRRTRGRRGSTNGRGPLAAAHVRAANGSRSAVHASSRATAVTMSSRRNSSGSTSHVYVSTSKCAQSVRSPTRRSSAAT